ncbi:glycoside hydrolase family 43 protein [Schizothecium vesticola]|uniref:Arabinan endo-1,5-alpha-L-arabinosidase n=1 Tax=Schizothecium vesticola TaxID=314040 RepID=A0AA40ELK6_9PEZI|nr:glycoside hydrolase family 43 protein [Schizothecium vesticola]
MFKLFLLTSLLFLLPIFHCYSLPEPCSGTCVNAHDPSIVIRPNGTYFRFSTGGKIAIHTAPDLRGPWTYKGAALPNGSKINLKGNQDLWAPDVSLVDNLYHLFYSVSTFGSQASAIGLARSPSMDAGTWTDLGAAGISSDATKRYNAIDPNLIYVNGTYHMSFGSFWDGIFQVEMNSPPTTAKSNVQPTQIVHNSAESAMEGPALFRYGEYYYLFFSKGQCCGLDRSRPAAGKEYRIMVCRSGVSTGGFVDKSGRACTNGGGTVVLESHGWVYGPGGQGVFQDPVHGPVVYYHYVDTRVGYADGQKRFGWNKLDFTTGWPAV